MKDDRMAADVLVVEDDPLQWINYQIALGGVGFRCDFAPDDSTAVRLLRTNRYRVILFDLGLAPSSTEVDSGFEDDVDRGEALYEKLTKLSDAPIIIVTIHRGTVKGDAALGRMKPTAVIDKPFSPSQLQTLVQGSL